MSHRLPVAETAQTRRKWNGFVCPECRHVFRVAQDHEGRGVVCPSCRRMLKLPADGDELPPLVIPNLVREPEIAPEPVSDDPDHPGMIKRRRRKNPREEEVFDETFAKKEDLSPKLVRVLIGSVALMGLILLVALLWPQADRPEVADDRPLPSVAKEDTGPSEEELEAARKVVPPVVVDQELVPVFRRFLDAESPEEMAEWVRHPEISLPRIKELYANGYEPAGFSKVVWSTAPTRTNGAVAVELRDGNFARQRVYAVDEDGWKIDWESWAGWSEISWMDFKENRPTEAVEFRVVVSDVPYFNFSFANEAEWSSYRLEAHDGEHVVFGYVPRSGPLDMELESLDEEEGRPFTLRLRYLENSESSSQVLIDSVVCEGWFNPGEK